MLDPIAFTLLGLEIYWYGIFYVLGFLLSYLFIKHYSKKLNIKNDHIENIFFYFMIFSVLGGRIFEIIFYSIPNLGINYYLNNPINLIAVWKGGMSIHGGIFFGALTLLYFSKKYKIDKYILTDLFSLPAGAALAFGRLANFINQELVGKITTSKLGVIFPLYDQNPRWPTQLFESAKNMITFQILYLTYIFKKTKPGTITAWFLILYSIGRFIIDFLRVPTTTYFSIPTGQILNIIYAIAGIILLYNIYKK